MEKSLAECEFALVYGWPKLVPSEILDLPKVGVFGIHGGPYEAPRCRGRAVFNWALIFGEENFFMYLFKLTKEADDGPIFKQINFSIERDEDIASIYFKSCYFVRRLVIEFLDEASSGGFNLIDQSNENGTYLPGRKPIHGGIDWSQSADQIVRFIRAQTRPFPGAFSMMCNVSVTIWRAQVFDRGHVLNGEPGEIIYSFAGDQFLVRAGNGIGVLIRDFQAVDNWLPIEGRSFDLKSGEEQTKSKDVKDVIMRNILVIGGAGCLGSHIAEFMVNNGDQVAVFDNFTTGSVENLSTIEKKINIFRGDAADFSALLAVFERFSPQYVVYAAASVMTQ